MSNEMRLNSADDDPFSISNLWNEEIENGINIKEDSEVLEPIVDDEMEKDMSGKNELCVTSVVSKDVEMTPFGKSLS